jgi:hypothetical protein
MSRRHLIRKFQVLTDSDSTTSPSSIATDVSGVDFITYQIDCALAVNSLLSVYFSNDDQFNSSNKTELDFGPALTIIGATDTSYVVHIENLGFKWLQLSFTNNGGTGLINAFITGAGRGA